MEIVAIGMHVVSSCHVGEGESDGNWTRALWFVDIPSS